MAATRAGRTYRSDRHESSRVKPPLGRPMPKPGSSRRLARQIRQAVLRASPEQMQGIEQTVRLLELRLITVTAACEQLTVVLREQQS